MVLVFSFSWAVTDSPKFSDDYVARIVAFLDIPEAERNFCLITPEEPLASANEVEEEPSLMEEEKEKKGKAQYLPI